MSIFRRKNLKAFARKWVKVNLGEEYVDDFMYKYDCINRGVPIGGLKETMAFLGWIDQIKQDMKVVNK